MCRLRRGLPPGGAISCPQCHATLAIANLGEAYDAVKSLAATLKQIATKPPPELVKRRLEAIEGNAAEQRRWAVDMERETRREPGPDDETAYGWVWRNSPKPLRIAFVVGTILIIGWNLR